MKRSFIVRHFDDYHEIRDFKNGSWKRKELGCFPNKHYGYCRYYALFWKGKIPSKDKIIKAVKRAGYIPSIIHKDTGELIEIDLLLES